MKEICVVHLVREQNGIEPFIRFLRSYRKHPGGINHQFLVLFKGFESNGSKDKFLKLLTQFNFMSIDVSDSGFDITAYFSAVEHFSDDFRFFCFLNSFSVIQDSNWLRKFYAQICKPHVGLVGASGSWQSHTRTGMLWPFVGAVYVAIRHYHKLAGMSFFKRLVTSYLAGWRHGVFIFDIAPFPNCHIRTNAFMISGALMNSIECYEIKSKLDAYRFESGKNGLTQQISKMGKEVLIVGRDGVGYGMRQWNHSKTFWQFKQENLLVSDNQTRDYQFGSRARKAYLSGIAWGIK